MFKKNFQNVAVIIFLWALPFFVLAQEVGDESLNPTESVGLAIDQSIFSFDTDPGKSADFKITIENISKNDQKVSLYAQDFSVGDNNQIEIMPNANEMSGMKDWLKINETDLVLGPGEKKEESFSVQVPSDATVGGHYTGLFFQAFPPVDANNFQKTIVSGRVGAFVLLNVKGAVSGKGNLNKLEAPILASQKEKITAEFENTGNIFYIPNGEVRVKNLITRQEKNIAVPKHFVFPGKKYSFAMEWNPESVLGIYRASAYFMDGDKNIHVAERFVFGKLFFVAVVFVIILILVILWFFKKRKFFNDKLPMTNDKSNPKSK